MRTLFKHVPGYVVAFALGSLMSGGVALAATNYVQATTKPSVIEFNGNAVSSPPALVYGGTTYVQLYSIQNGLQQVFGTRPTWDGTHFNVVTSSTQTGGTSSSSGGSVVALSSLPYTFKASDGMTVTVNSINATSTSTVFDITVANNGLQTDGDAALSMFGSSLSDGASTVKLESDADADLTSPYDSTYNDLHPGQSVKDTLTFDPLQAGTKQFTWYFKDFGLNTQQITFDLSK